MDQFSPLIFAYLCLLVDPRLLDPWLLSLDLVCQLELHGGNIALDPLLETRPRNNRGPTLPPRSSTLDL